jgi:hypothetical protein
MCINPFKKVPHVNTAAEQGIKDLSFKTTPQTALFLTFKETTSPSKTSKPTSLIGG